MRIIIYNFFITFKRFKVSCLLTVTGLSVAFAVFYLTFVQSCFDLSFDRNFEKADSIFLYSRIGQNLGSSSTSMNAFEAMVCAERYSEIKDLCYLYSGNHPFAVTDEQTGEIRIFDETLITASDGFIDIFSPKILLGDAKNVFSPDASPRNVMLTESLAKKMFGNRNPIGEIFTWYNMRRSVAAVCADFPDNCSLKNGIYARAYEERKNSSFWAYTTYFKIDPKNIDRLLKKMNDEQYMQKLLDRENDIWKYELTALPRVHLWFPAKGEGNPVSVVLLLTTGILLLVVSYINFINFSIAMAPVRVKSINLRKILGESPFMLKMSLIIEAGFLSFISFLLSVLIIGFVNTGALQDFFRADISLTENLGLLIFAGTVFILSGFIAGIYPAYYTAAFNPAVALSGSFSQSHVNKLIKNVLTGIQLFAAIFLITSTFFIRMQNRYLLNKSWGINTENVLYFYTEIDRIHVDNFMTEIERSPIVTGVTSAAYYPGQRMMQVGRPFGDIYVNTNYWPVMPDFFDFFGVNNVEGDRFKEGDSRKMIINRAFTKKYGFGDNLIGRELDGYEIIGVVEDFNFKSLHGDIQPLALTSIYKGANGDYNYVFVKKSGATPDRQAIELIRDTWKKLSNKPIKVLSLTDTIRALYKKERNTAEIISICGIIAIIVSIIGLYGLILFEAKAKRKNIALRKIHGASITEILLMLNKGLFVRFAVAFIISVPFTYYAVHRWLEGFAYKTTMHWWVFISGGLIVLLISLFTVSWESYRAASDNPMKVIKTE